DSLAGSYSGRTDSRASFPRTPDAKSKSWGNAGNKEKEGRECWWRQQGRNRCKNIRRCHKRDKPVAPLSCPILSPGLGADPHHYSCDLEGTQPSLMSPQSLQFCSTVLISLYHNVALG
uniref:Uncharacterized protein n=1 Tax=Chlorocebus sabaeus TaxID=60711 RepID=A0A0D9R6G8_CHLSB